MATIFQHFQPEEHEFVAKALDWLDQAENKSSPLTTYFLNPREVHILEALAASRSVRCDSSAKLVPTEYVKVLLAPDYYEPTAEDFHLSLLEIHYAAKFSHLTHSQILGTFLSVTGLSRRELGDILILEDKAFVFVSQAMVSYFVNSISRIASTPVHLTEVPVETGLEIVTKLHSAGENRLILTSSRRLDKIIAISCTMSRNFAANMIQLGDVKVNYRQILKNDFLLSEGDLISIKGVGRIEILDSLGFSKKNKEKLELRIIFVHSKN